MANVRTKRQDAIRKLVNEGRIKTQGQLKDLLHDQGFDATQATISRDIAELDLRKDPHGFYMLPEYHKLSMLAASIMHETRRAGNQVLILSDPGTAPSIAAALDAAKIEGVLGCIAGDDTVLVICADEEQGEKVQASIDVLIDR